MWGRSASHAASSGQDWSLKRTIINVDERWQKNKRRDEMKIKRPSLHFNFIFLLISSLTFRCLHTPRLSFASLSIVGRQATTHNSLRLFLFSTCESRARERELNESGELKSPTLTSLNAKASSWDLKKKTDDYLPFVIKQILKIVDCCRAYE